MDKSAFQGKEGVRAEAGGRYASAPRELLDRVIDYFQPRRIILFGSRARGEATADSDIDLIVILDDDAPKEHLTLKAGWESRRGYNRATDVIPVRASVYDRRAKIAGTLAYEAAIDGIAVYERGGSPVHAGRSPGGQALVDPPTC